MGSGSEAALIPCLEIGELIVGGERRVRFTVALHLGDFVDRLPAHPPLRVVAIQRLPRGQRYIVEHQAQREVAVVRNGQYAAARLLLSSGHPLPEILGIDAVILRERDDLIGLSLAIPENNIPMEIVAVRSGG